MKRLRLAPMLLFLLAATGFVATACGTTVAPDTLSVNGTTLSREALLDQLDVMAANKDILLSSSTAVYGPTEGSYDAAFVASVLSGRVQSALVAEEVARRGIQPTADDKAKLAEQLAASISGATSATGVTQEQIDAGQAKLAEWGEYGTYLVDNIANLNALEASFTKEVATEDALRAYYNQNIDQFTQACVSHILIRAGSGQSNPQTGAVVPGTDAEFATAQAKAADLKRQIDAGADFAAIAQANSTDTGSASKGGDLGCQAKGAYVTEFDDAVWSLAVGTVSQPVKTDFGYHIIKVTKRGPLTFEEARTTIEKAFADQVTSALRDWYFAAAAKATVTVDPIFGQWSAEQAQVLPPEGPSSPSTTSVLDQLGTPLAGSGTESGVPTP